jgi:hypothetical protein
MLVLSIFNGVNLNIPASWTAEERKASSLGVQLIEAFGLTAPL